MNVLRSSVALVAVLLIAGWAVVAGPFTFERGGTITITGTSNVHGWTCAVPTYTATGAGEASGTTLTRLTALTVTVPVTGINCNNNRTMNGKLREALGTSPISYTLTSATVGAVRSGRFPISVQGRMNIHGTARPIAITAQAQSLGGNRFKVTGSVPVTMSQFGVTPPRAMAGAMRTGDRVTVDFDVTMNAGR